MKETLSIGLWLVLTGAAITAVIFVAQTMRSKEPVLIGLYRNREHTMGSLIYLALVVIGGMAIVGVGVYGLLTWLPSSADQFRGMLAVGAAFCSLFILAHLERVTFIRQELAVNNASLTWIDYQLHYSSRPSDGEIERLKEESRDPNKTDTELQIARWTLALAKEINERDKRTETQVILRLQREQEEKEAKDADRERLAAQKAAKEQTQAINLQELLKQDFGIDFPISGGTGVSRDNPIIIHRKLPNDYTSVEYGVLRCLGIGRGVDWKIIQQAIMDYAGRTLDQLKVQTKTTTDNEIITQIENYYFDITECMEAPRLVPMGHHVTDAVEASKDDEDTPEYLYCQAVQRYITDMGFYDELAVRQLTDDEYCIASLQLQIAGHLAQQNPNVVGLLIMDSLKKYETNPEFAVLFLRNLEKKFLNKES